MYVTNETKFMKLSLWKMEEKITANMKPANVIRELHNKGVLTDSEVKRLKATESEYKTNLLLVGSLKRKTYQEFKVFIEALHNTDQSYLVDILKSQGK